MHQLKTGKTSQKNSYEAEESMEEDMMSDRNTTTASSKRMQQKILTSFSWSEAAENRFAVMYKYQISSSKDEVKLTHVYFSPLMVQLLGVDSQLFQIYLLRHGFPEIFVLLDKDSNAKEQQQQ